MAITCPKCAAEFDITLFQFGRGIHCDCDQWVELDRGHVIEQETPTDKPQLVLPNRQVDPSVRPTIFRI
jgi:hypothetical protein